MTRITLDQLFDEMRAKRLAELAAQDADPVYQAEEAERRRLRAEQIDREIAEGLRDAEGQWIETDPEDDDGEDEYDPDAVEEF